MGNCQYCSRKKRKKVSILLVGLDNAGKTTAAKVVQKLPLNTVAPTVGYTADHFKFGNYHITLIDVGGGKKIRDIWKNYFAEVHGVIYVVDSADHARIEECKSELTELIRNPLIQEKPLLLLANKQDKMGAFDEVDISNKLNLEKLVNENRCYCKVETTSALAGNKNKAIKNGLVWILSTIDLNYDQLNSRVIRDTRTRDLKLKEEMAIRRQTIMCQMQMELEEKEDKENANRSPEPVVTGASESLPKSHSPNAETTTVRSGLGSQLLDDNSYDGLINLPGSVDDVETPVETTDDVDVIKPISSLHPDRHSPLNSSPMNATRISGSSHPSLSLSLASDTSMGGLTSDTTGLDRLNKNSTQLGTARELLPSMSPPRPIAMLPSSTGRSNKLPPLFSKPNADDDVVL